MRRDIEMVVLRYEEAQRAFRFPCFGVETFVDAGRADIARAIYTYEYTLAYASNLA